MEASNNFPFYNESKISGADKNTIVASRLKTPFGEMLAGATDKGICLLEFTDTNRVEIQLSRLEKVYGVAVVAGNSPFFSMLNKQLHEYFEQKREGFDVPLDARGTPFQMQAWNALLKIPFGETRSYQQQALAINNPKAIRAVASANRNNRVSILIPCHRVIAKSGGMAGYGGGIWRKEYLLTLEKAL